MQVKVQRFLISKQVAPVHMLCVWSQLVIQTRYQSGHFNTTIQIGAKSLETTGNMLIKLY
jgi:hypothetical protein